MSDAAGSCIIDISRATSSSLVGERRNRMTAPMTERASNDCEPLLGRSKEVDKKRSRRRGQDKEGVRTRLTHHTIGVIIKADMS